MAISAGNVQSELILNANKYFSTLKKAEEKMQSFEEQVKQSSSKMDSSLTKIDKQYKLWEMSASGVEKALYGKGKEVDSLKQKLNLLGNEISNNNTKLENAKQEYGDNSKEVKELEDNILVLKKRQAELNNEMNKFSFGNRLQEAGNKLVSFGKTLTTYVTLPIMGLGVAAVKSAADFEQGVSNIKAVSGATADEMGKLQKLALKMGADTSFSAKEAAQGIEELIKAGVSVTDILNGGLSGALSLAAAGELELADAAEIASTALNAFKNDNITVTQAANILAGAANASATSVGEMKYSLSAVASVAASVGLSFEDTATALAAFAQNGLKGSDAGTSLKTMLMSLQPQTDKQRGLFKELGLITTKTVSSFVANEKQVGNNAEKIQELNKKIQELTSKGLLGNQKAITKSNSSIQSYSEKISDLNGKVSILIQKQAEFTDKTKESTKMTIVNRIADYREEIIKLTSKMNSLKSTSLNINVLPPDIAKKVSEYRAEIQKLGGTVGKTKTSVIETGNAFFTANGKLKNMTEIADVLRNSMKDMTDQQRLATMETIFGSDAIRAANILFKEGAEGIKKMKSEMSKVTAEQVAAEKLNNLKGSWEQLRGSLETAAIAIGTIVIPHIRNLVDHLTKLTNKFMELNPETQETIVKVAGLVAVAGPLLSIGGKLTSGIGSIIKFFGLFNQVAGGASAAATTVGASASTAAGTGGIAGLTSSMGGFVAAAAPYAAAAAVVAGADYIVYDQLTKETIPAVDLFADKIEATSAAMTREGNGMSWNTTQVATRISEATKLAIGAYVELDNGIRNTLNDIYLNSTQITEQNKNELVSKYQQMGEMINSNLKAKGDENIINLQDFFSKSSAITEKEEINIINKTNEFYKNKQKVVSDYQTEIKTILENASKEHRSITEEESKTIIDLQNKMREDSIKILSDNEVEAKVILERMKEYDKRITAEQVAEHIKKLNESRDKAVNATNDEYEKRIATIIKMRDEAKVISAAQADALIEDAKRQKDGVVNKAEETRIEAIKKMASMNKDIENQVDTTTGNILTWWDKVKRWWSGWKPETKTFSTVQKTTSDDIQQYNIKNRVPNNAHGTAFFSGGWTWAGEQGRELIELPRGSRIYSNQQSENMVNEKGSNGDIIVENMNVRNDNDIKLVARELYNLQNNRRRALGVT